MIVSRLVRVLTLIDWLVGVRVRWSPDGAHAFCELALLWLVTRLYVGYLISIAVFFSCSRDLVYLVCYGSPVSVSGLPGLSG